MDKAISQQQISQRSMILGLVLLLGFGIWTILVMKQPLNQIDQQVAAFVQSYESDMMTRFMMMFSFLGSTKTTIMIAALTMIILFAVLKHRSELLFFVAALGGAAAFNQLLKLLFHRERPTIYRMVEETGFSYPSGHTMGAMAMYGAIVFLLWRHIKSKKGRTVLIFVSVFAIIMIGLSRIYLGVHYPSDIVGGLMASALWLSAVIWFYQWYLERRARE